MPTIPNGPGTDPLNLSGTDFEFLAMTGPSETLVNQVASYKADGTFLRVVATQSRLAYTANYQVLTTDPAMPAVGLHSVVVGEVTTKVWITSVAPSGPQAADRTLAVQFWIADDVAEPEGLAADLVVAARPDLGAGYADATIPFGPGLEPIGLAAADFEYISIEGPAETIENERGSNTKDGLHLRTVGTRGTWQWTANYQILDASAALPRCGLLDASAAQAGSHVWITAVNPAQPQDGDQTLAVTFQVWFDVDAEEALHTDFGLREPEA